MIVGYCCVDCVVDFILIGFVCVVLVVVIVVVYVYVEKVVVMVVFVVVGDVECDMFGMFFDLDCFSFVCD